MGLGKIQDQINKASSVIGDSLKASIGNSLSTLNTGVDARINIVPCNSNIT